MVQHSDIDHTGVTGVPSSTAPIATGTSNPGSPSTNDLIFRTDLGLLAYYTGSAWHSLTLYTMDLNAAFDGSATAAVNGWPLAAANSPRVLGRKSFWHSDFQLYIVDLYGESFTATTNNGSNFWTAALAGVVTSTAYGSLNTSAATASTHTGHRATIDTAAGATERGVTITYTKTGTPGDTFFPCLMTYRLIIP